MQQVESTKTLIYRSAGRDRIQKARSKLPVPFKFHLILTVLVLTRCMDRMAITRVVQTEANQKEFLVPISSPISEVKIELALEINGKISLLRITKTIEASPMIEKTMMEITLLKREILIRSEQIPNIAVLTMVQMTMPMK